MPNAFNFRTILFLSKRSTTTTTANNIYSSRCSMLRSMRPAKHPAHTISTDPDGGTSRIVSPILPPPIPEMGRRVSERNVCRDIIYAPTLFGEMPLLAAWLSLQRPACVTQEKVKFIRLPHSFIITMKYVVDACHYYYCCLVLLLLSLPFAVFHRSNNLAKLNV